MNINFPDKWDGWRLGNDGKVDLGLDDPDYLERRGKFLAMAVFGANPKNLNESLQYNGYDMVDLINLTKHSADEIITNIDSYSNRQILSWGCGSGKTNKIKAFCATTMLSTLIVVNTNDEIKKMVFDILALNPEQSVVGYYSNDVGNSVMDNVEFLRKFRVVVTNSWRLANDPMHVLMRSDEAPQSTYQKYSLAGVSSVRKVVIIDELPGMAYRRNFQDFVIDSMVGCRRVPHPNNIKELSRMTDLIMSHGYKILSQVFDVSETANALSYERIADRVVGMMNYMSKEVHIHKSDISLKHGCCYVKTLLEMPKETKILVLDGTGHLIFKDSSVWSVEKKYQKSVVANNIGLIDFNTDRYKYSGTARDRVVSIDNDLSKIVDSIEEMLKSGKKVFVVTWKTVDLSETITIDGHSVTGYSIIDKLTYMLSSRVPTDLMHNFSGTTYGSGKCRATNEFIDYDTIMFIGKWSIHPTAVRDKQSVTRNSLTSNDIVLSEMIQSVFRTRARVGKPIDIYFCGNHDDKGTTELVTSVIDEIVENPDDWLIRVMCLKFAQAKLRSNLFTDFTALFDKIDWESKSISVSLDEIFLLCPRAKKRKESYDALVRSVMDNLGLTLEVLN